MSDDEIKRYANFIKSRRLELPAKLLLESHLPLAGLMENMGHLAMPLLAPLIGAERMERILELIRDRRSLERLAAQL